MRENVLHSAPLKRSGAWLHSYDNPGRFLRHPGRRAAVRRHRGALHPRFAVCRGGTGPVNFAPFIDGSYRVAVIFLIAAGALSRRRQRLAANRLRTADARE